MPHPEIMKLLEKGIREFPEKIRRAAEVLSGELDYPVATTPADIVFQEDNLRLLHYRPLLDQDKIHSPPILIVYALINRYIMLDLEPGRSFIRNLLKHGLDVYLIDWGYPSGPDLYLSMDDYISSYLDTVVDRIRSRSDHKRINLMGVCQGGTFCVIYTALYPEKVRNLITLATPTQFDVNDAALFMWAKKFNPDRIIETFGCLPGDLANILYLLVVPVATVNKYIRFLDHAEDRGFVNTFLRMEKWIFDSPDMAGPVFKEWLGDLLQKNLLIQNEFFLNNRHVDLHRITCPLLNVYGEKDYLAPPSTARPLSTAVGSTDITTLGVDTGHLGIFVGSTSNKTIIPEIVKWIKNR
ncbi:MAG: class III poly(R)-hydroxyalkanoic acid synthase subunit PhaC [Thermodesulfobacteriota bacterium]